MSAGPGSAARSLLAAPSPNRHAPGRSSPAPRPIYAGAALLAAGVGLGATAALTITAETSSQLTAPGGLATFAGNATGMVGTYLALMMVLLVSRIPVIERVLGQDGLLRWHRRLAPWPISLPLLRSEVLTVQSARIDGISGATYTSEAYVQSLQAALDSLHLK